MNAVLVVKTANGYAVAPYEGDIPPNFVSDMSVAMKLSSYSYANETVIKALEDYFEPAPVEQLKVAA